MLYALFFLQRSHNIVFWTEGALSKSLLFLNGRDESEVETFQPELEFHRQNFSFSSSSSFFHSHCTEFSTYKTEVLAKNVTERLSSVVF